ncbi:MAG TPA: glutathione S-transferase C-terminal domain-containing protein, partial [Burkholderiales bacterium]|nr:glutathione S-transferase C-terminal domain-containing protein [Burkholderiales bacterium]
AEFMAKQEQKSTRGLSVLEHEAEHLIGPITIGQIAVGCCLGYLDFRFAGEPWRPTHPRLAEWFNSFSQRQSMVATNPPHGGH